MKSIIKLTSLIIVSFAITGCNKGGEYSVTFASEHGTWQGASYASKDVNYVATFTPEQGYDLKGSDLYVLVNDNRINNYTFYDNRLTIEGAAITGNIKITATASAIEYNIVNNIKNATIGSTKAYHHQTLELKVTPRDYYALPDNIKVYVGDKELESGYTYLPNDNKLIIDSEYVTNTITLSGDSIQLYLVKFNSTDSGSWKDGAKFKDVFVKKGTTFGEAKKLVTEPDAKEDAKEFDFWGAETTTTDPIDDNTKIEKYGFNAYGQYRPVVLNVSGQSSSYGFDWKGLFKHHTDQGSTIGYGEQYKIALNLGEWVKDEGSETEHFELKGQNYFMPDAIKITIFNRKTSKEEELTLNTDYTILAKEDETYGKQLEVTINPTGTRGDITMTVNPYRNAVITFDTDGGTWSEGGSDAKTATIKVGSPDLEKINILEASRLKIDSGTQIIQMPTKGKRVFKGWYDVDKGEEVSVNSIVSDNLNLRAVYTDPTFETDTWENIKMYANQGSAALLAHYGKSLASDLIACTRDIVIGNRTLGYTQQKIILIDIDHDDLPGSTPEIPLKATLTFMFQKVCTTSVFDDETESVHNRWETATLRKSCALGGVIPDLRPVRVKKTTYYNERGKGDGYYDTEDAFFAFSQNELNLTSASGVDVKDEGSPYAYFRDMGGSLKRDSVLTDDNSYWLRSPYHIDTSNNYSYYIDEDGNVQHDRYDASHGILAGFCIGQAQSN